jgi:hypothetical protein
MTDNGTAAGYAPRPNGWGGFNAGMKAIKASEYEGGHRVPFFIRWPGGGVGGGRDIDTLTAHIDVLPTLLEACGLPPAEGVDGLSLLPLLKGDVEELPPRTLFFQWHRGDAPELGRACAAVEARWKWLRPGAPDSPAMLFDLRADPGESRDLAGEFPDEANRLKAAYAKYRDDPTSPVLVLGDSFLRIYQTDAPTSAGFIAHLARELRHPVASVVNDGGASTLVRQELARRPQLLAGKKVVIWEFVERDIRFGTEGWKRVPLSPDTRAAMPAPFRNP